VAPWVLSKQAIPIHCVWVPEEKLKKIVIIIPSDYHLCDTLNFTQYDFDKTSNSILLSADDLKSNNYLGIVLEHPDLIEGVEKRDKVAINFLDAENKILAESTFYTRIVRPQLELLQFPKEIIVTDETNPRNLINLEILHRGFGTANLIINVTHSGADISKIDSIYFDVLRGIFERVLTSVDYESLDSFDDPDIDEKLVRKIADEILSSKSVKNLPVELSEDQLKQIKEIMKEAKSREAIYRIVYSSLRSLLLAALLYYDEKHPAEDIKLLDGQIAAYLKGRIDELVVKIDYYDSLGNVYPPLEAKIKVIDNRTKKDKSGDLEAPINIIWKKDLLNLEEQSN
jgi:hypothetical protein